MTTDDDYSDAMELREKAEMAEEAREEELAALKAENARLYAANVALQAGAVEAALEWLDDHLVVREGVSLSWIPHLPRDVKGRRADESWTTWLLRVHREATAP